MQPWLNAASKQTHNLLLHDECASNLPSHGARFRPSDETLQVLIQFLQEMKIDQARYLNDDDHAFPPLPTVPGRH